ncbi:unnamed protein product [Brugia timori]|uniref:Uncharacterized protein n=1 Tax=Brugia timori TaxID=42155 RepID=A0A0R3QV70_9BILA|nr:unnamed protein product [Brugia timori]
MNWKCRFPSNSFHPDTNNGELKQIISETATECIDGPITSSTGRRRKTFRSGLFLSHTLNTVSPKSFR